MAVLTRSKPPSVVSAAAAKLGSAGGLARKDALSRQRRREIARKGGYAKARRNQARRT